MILSFPSINIEVSVTDSKTSHHFTHITIAFGNSITSSNAITMFCMNHTILTHVICIINSDTGEYNWPKPVLHTSAYASGTLCGISTSTVVVSA